MRRSFATLLFCCAFPVSFPVALAATESGDSGGKLLVVNQGDHTLSVFDAASGKRIRSIDVGGVTGHEVAMLPDGRTAVVPIYGDSGVGKPGTNGQRISFVDITSGAMIRHLDFDHGVRPHCAIYDKTTGKLLVTTELDQAIAIIDPRTATLAGKTPTGQPESHMFALTRDGRRGYTANVHAGTISVLDLSAHRVMKVVHVSPEVQRIALSADEHLVFTSDQTQPRMAVFDTGTNALRGWIPLPSSATAWRPPRWPLAAGRPACSQ